jgi:uncharacterized protein
MTRAMRCLGLVPLLWCCGAVAALQPVPDLTGRVVDQSGTLSAEQKATLTAQLADLEQRKGSQLVILLVASTAPESIEQYGVRVASAWQLGRKGVDDGLLLLVAREDRAVRIEVGRGLEGAIPDAIANRIIDEYLVPRFRGGDYAGGLAAAAQRLAALVDGEPLPAPPSPTGAAGGVDQLMALLPVILVVVVVASSLLQKVLGRGPAAVGTGVAAAGITWLITHVLPLSLVVLVLASVLALAGFGRGGPGWVSHRRFPGGMYPGSGGFGGGGFRGGGGGFGGGGASGRW